MDLQLKRFFLEKIKPRDYCKETSVRKDTKTTEVRNGQTDRQTGGEEGDKDGERKIKRDRTALSSRIELIHTVPLKLGQTHLSLSVYLKILNEAHTRTECTQS